MSSESEHHHVVRVHIDRKPHEVTEPVTADRLYTIGKVREGYDLYREVFGDEEDQLIRRGEERIHLHPNEHFYSTEHHEKGHKIVVNTVEFIEPHRRLSFEQIVKIAFPTLPAGDTMAFAVTYEDGPRHKPEGTLVAGQSVKIRNGMIFDVTANNRS